jgi:hypothetical protein
MGHEREGGHQTVGATDGRMTAIRRTTAVRRKTVRFALRVIRIMRMIAVPCPIEEIATAKVIEFYIPKNFRKSFKWVPELQRGKILELYPETKKSA